MIKTHERFGKARQFYLEPGNVIEAWKGGVRLAASISASHTPHTKVDVFEFKTPLCSGSTKLMAQFLCAQIGKPYDYLSIIRFLTREPDNRWNMSKWFCSCLAFEAALTAGRELLERTPAWKVPPAWIPMSPLLRFVSSEWTS